MFRPFIQYHCNRRMLYSRTHRIRNGAAGISTGRKFANGEYGSGGGQPPPDGKRIFPEGGQAGAGLRYNWMRFRVNVPSFQETVTLMIRPTSIQATYIPSLPVTFMS